MGKSSPDGGSACTVYLPVGSEEHAVGPRVLPPSADGVQPASQIFKGRAVLVLDDEESIRMLLGEGLSAHGLHVDTAQSANEALQLIKSRPYDVLLCDLNLSATGFATGGREAAQASLGARVPGN